MSLAILSDPLPLYAHSVEIVRPVVTVTFGGQTEARAQRSSRCYRRFPYAWGGLTSAQKATLDAFFIARGMTRDSFLWRDPNPDADEPFVRTGAALGTSTLTQTVFSLPTGENEAGGDYPVDDGRTVLYSDGAVVSSRTVQTDARTITAAVAPGNGHVITASYAFYRRVRLESGLTWAKSDHGLWSTSLVFREVPA